MLEKMTSSSTQPPPLQEEGATAVGSSTRTIETRLQSIEILLDRYRQNQFHEQEQQNGCTPIADSGYYVHPTLSYVPDQYGGICGRTKQPVKKNEILLVIPQQERLSLPTVGPTLQPKSLYTHHLHQILKECKLRLSNDYPFVDTNNIITALLIMYCWKKNNSNDDELYSSNGNKSNGKHNKMTNLQLYMESWPSNEDLLSSYFSKDVRQNMLQGTGSEYYLQERTKAQDVIVDIILNVLKSKKDTTEEGSLANRFCADSSHEGFSKVFATAWKIVDSRCHTGLEGT